MSTDCHDAIREEMIFHLSMVDGLSEQSHMEEFTKASGSARGLGALTEELSGEKDSKKAIKNFWEESLKAYRSDDVDLINGGGEFQDNLAKGFLFGVARAWAIAVHDEKPLGEYYGPNRESTESFKCPPNLNVSERNSNVSN